QKRRLLDDAERDAGDDQCSAGEGSRRTDQNCRSAGACAGDVADEEKGKLARAGDKENEEHGDEDAAGTRERQRAEGEEEERTPDFIGEGPERRIDGRGDGGEEFGAAEKGGAAIAEDCA